MILLSHHHLIHVHPKLKTAKEIEEQTYQKQIIKALLLRFGFMDLLVDKKAKHLLPLMATFWYDSQLALLVNTFNMF